MPPLGFEPTIAVGERPKTYVLDRAATGTGDLVYTDNGVNLSYINDIQFKPHATVLDSCKGSNASYFLIR
jgi:hypothetical protein